MAALTNNWLMALRESGLIVKDRGVEGCSFETTGDLPAAVERHERVLRIMDEDWAPAWRALSPAARRLIALPSNEAVLSMHAMQRATSPEVQSYCDGDTLWVEWEFKGYVDRREVSTQTGSHAIADLGFAVTVKDWRDVNRLLAQLFPGERRVPPYEAFLADATAWWHARMPTPLLAHAIGAKPFQLLNRAALARKVSGMPQTRSVGDRPCLPDSISAYLSGSGTNGGTQSLEALIRYVGDVVRDKPSKDHGRALIIGRIALLMPAAAKEGRGQVLIFGAIRHALVAGGMGGALWAPVTIWAYLRVGARSLVKLLTEIDVTTLSGAQLHEAYEKMFEGVRVSQWPKLAAFIQVFHRFLTLAGAEPLAKALPGGEDPLPPAAAMVWPAEFDRSISYVQVVTSSERISLQAKAILLLGYEIEMRTVEFWCIRIGDVLISGTVSVVIYPRRRDGVGKSPALRRVVDVESTALKEMLIDFVKLRRSEGALDDDVLFGRQGIPGARLAPLQTEALVNAALRWATGDSGASIYDLRHTCFSRKAAELFEHFDPTDLMAFLQLCARGGHAGPDSTWWYIHLIEAALGAWGRKVRPLAWASAQGGSNYSAVFPHLCDGQIEPIPPIPPAGAADVDAKSSDISLETRLRIVREIQLKRPVELVAAAAEVAPAVVVSVASELTEALMAAQMMPQGSSDSLQNQCRAITAMSLWGRATQQAKHEGMKDRLGQMMDSHQWSALLLLWQDWLQCVYGDDISLSQERSAVRLIKFLFDAGVQPSALVISSAPVRPAVSDSLTSLGIEVRPAKVRRGEAPHRLFMAAPGIRAVEASGATLSMRGFAWLMLVVGSALIARGDA